MLCWRFPALYNIGSHLHLSLFCVMIERLGWFSKPTATHRSHDSKTNQKNIIILSTFATSYQCVSWGEKREGEPLAHISSLSGDRPLPHRAFSQLCLRSLQILIKIPFPGFNFAVCLFSYLTSLLAVVGLRQRRPPSCCFICLTLCLWNSKFSKMVNGKWLPIL